MAVPTLPKRVMLAEPERPNDWPAQRAELASWTAQGYAYVIGERMGVLDPPAVMALEACDVRGKILEIWNGPLAVRLHAEPVTND